MKAFKCARALEGAMGVGIHGRTTGLIGGSPPDKTSVKGCDAMRRKEW